MEHKLYRFYNYEGGLIYVGLTIDGPRRFRQHSESQDWWREVGQILMENYPDRAAVKAAESEAIRREHPLYNIRENAVPKRRPDSIIWRCDACGKPIKPEQGCLHVDYRMAIRNAAEEFAREVERVGREDRSVGLSDIPLVWPVPWQAHHYQCAERIPSDYGIDVARWASTDDALEWTARLSEKPWFHHTDFAHLLRSSKTPRRGKRSRTHDDGLRRALS